MARRTLILGAIATLFLLAACVPVTPDGGTVPAPIGPDAPVSSETPAPAADGADPLAGTAWQLTSVVDADGALAAVAEGVDATANFEQGTLSGRGGCNNFSGPYTVDGDTITIGAVASTMMACEDPAMSTESAYFVALGQVKSFAVEGDVLRLLDADGNALLEFATRTATSLSGVTWELVNFNNGNQAVVTLLEGTSATAVFGDDGQVTGQACNNFFGPYTVDGDTIAIGPLASTMMACPEPEGATEQEGQILMALERAATWSTDGTQLELRSAEDELIAIFVVAEE